MNQLPNQDFQRHKRLADNFLKNSKEIDNQDIMIEKFESLEPGAQKLVIANINHDFKSGIVKFLPFKRFQTIYEEVVNTKPVEYTPLISSIAKFYSEEAENFLLSLFRTVENVGVCAAAAEGLAKSKNGLITLENGIRSDYSWQQVGAIKGIVRTVEGNDLIEVIGKYKNHKNYEVRLECLFGFNKAKALSKEIVSSAFHDENENIRYRTLHLIREINNEIAKDFVTLLEDRKGYIVSEVLEILEKAQLHRFDEKAIADAIVSELIVRESGRPSEYFNTDIVSRALFALFKWNSRLYGEIMKSLCSIALDHKGYVRCHAVLVALSIDERGFLSLINDFSEEKPESVKEVLNLATGSFDSNLIANQISGTDPSDIQQNAANQIKLLSKYHENGLQQAKTSFNWAIALSLAGFPFLLFAIYYIVVNKTDSATSIISAIASSVVELIAGTLFYLYNQTRKQLTYYHKQMNQTQRFLLANSVAESLDGAAKENARIELIKTIASSEPNFQD